MKQLSLMAMGLALFAAACGGPTATVTGEIKGILILAEAPLFEGANTAIGEWDIDLTALTGQEGLRAEDLKNARIKSVTLSLDDPENEGLLEQITLQLTAPSSDMKKVAFLNPVPTNGTTYTLQVAETQKNLVELFQQGLVTVVADVNIREDYDDDLRLLIDIQFELDVKN
jgi:hypothetical protein